VCWSNAFLFGYAPKEFSPQNHHLSPCTNSKVMGEEGDFFLHGTHWRGEFLAREKIMLKIDQKARLG